MRHTRHILSYSGGKDSTAMYLLAMELAERHGFEFFPVFADTGNEHEATLDYVRDLPRRTGGPEIRWVKADFAEDFERKRRFIAAKWPDDLIKDVPGRWEVRPEFLLQDESGETAVAECVPDEAPPEPADPYQPMRSTFFQWIPARRSLSPEEAAIRVERALAGPLLTSGRLQVEQTYIAHTLRAEGFDASEDGSGRVTLVPVAYRTAGDGGIYEEGDRTAPLTTGTDQNANVVAIGVAIRGRDGGAAIECGDDLAHALRSSQGGGDKPFALIASGGADPVAAAVRLLVEDPQADIDAIVRALAAAGVSLHVRRLLPVECERLQGFPDGYTDIPWRGRAHCPDGPRYKALGNSMAVSVMRWLGLRIEAVEAALAERGRP